MDLSTDVQNLHELKFIRKKNEPSAKTMYSNVNYDLDIIEVNKIKFENDEFWLYRVPRSEEDPVTNLQEWLYKDLNSTSRDEYFPNPAQSAHEILQNDSQKHIDTRTFTRPKKRFTRPSIEKYNEEVYGNSCKIQNEHESTKKVLDADGHSEDIKEPAIIPIKPLNFDLAQPTSSYYFENILANCAEIDSFQNMSPPSLVNSMCSSTFANLMESSFIKNDPVLREIRDTDYTETILLQDSEPPMFQSITESCSSINSDTPENFLKRVSCNGTFKKNSSNVEKSQLTEISNGTLELDATYEKPEKTNTQNVVIDNKNKDERKSRKEGFANINGTYHETPKTNGTFRKSDLKNSTLFLKSSLDTPPDGMFDQTKTVLIKDSTTKCFDGTKTYSRSNIINDEDVMEQMKKQLSETQHITDLNRLSYCLDENRLDTKYTEENNDLNRTVNVKRSPFGCSTGSADSLDRMSSLSNSSRESNKILNMADVDAIVEMQERSLQQVMSTPKQNVGYKKIWENNFISPIISNEFSDSDVSSNDEYKSVKSTLSKVSLESYNTKPIKSLGCLGGTTDTKLKTNHRSTYTLAGQRPLQVISSNIGGSYNNLKIMQSNIPGSQSNLYKLCNIRQPTSATNLKSMGQKLKGSYTSLKPMSANLPVVPPISSSLNTTMTLSLATNPNVTQNINHHIKIAEVAPMQREKVSLPGDNHFVKPQQHRASGLPRPTGIPRPASRIPGPRTNIRPVSSRSTNYRRQTRDDCE